jgi:hypothetical protein
MRLSFAVHAPDRTYTRRSRTPNHSDVELEHELGVVVRRRGHHAGDVAILVEGEQ